MGWSEKDFCIKCDKGGKLLVCSDSSCPIAVHEKCMGLPAKFVEMGSFYCPYCLYRRAVEESRQAKEKALSRKKALSNFLDMQMINGDCQTQETGTSEGKESTQLLGLGKANSTHSWNDDNRLNSDNVHNHPVQLRKDQEKDTSTPECSRYVLLSKETDISLLNNQNDVSYSKYGDISGSSDCNPRLVVVGHRTESGPIVACGDECVCPEEDETIQQFEMVEIRSKTQLQPEGQDGHEQRGRMVDDNIDDNHLGDRPVAKQGAEDNCLTQAKRVANDANTFEETEDRFEGQEEVQEQVHENTAFPASDPALQVDLEEERVAQTSDSICTESKSTFTRKRKQDYKIKDQSVDASLRRSSGNSASALRANADQFENIHASRKSIKLTEPSLEMNLFPNARRKSLPWRDEEEEMLQEGVQKFSTTVKKNIPWRKILEFGQHVFDRSRTPVDLKDKWRNMLAKER